MRLSLSLFIGLYSGDILIAMRGIHYQRFQTIDNCACIAERRLPSRNAIIHLPHRIERGGQVVVALEDRGTLLLRGKIDQLPVDPLRTKIYPQAHRSATAPASKFIDRCHRICDTSRKSTVGLGPCGSREPNLGCRCVSKRNRISES
jgi:hypothetical protein